MLRQLGWLVLLAGGALAQPAKPAAPAAHPDFRISGTVAGGTSGEPLSRIEVEIGEVQAREASQRLVTGRDGRFAFSGLIPGKYWLTAEGRGFPRQAYEQHEQFSTGIAVGLDKPSENLVFRLHADCSISGKVLDEQNDPVRDAEVMLFQNGLQQGERITFMRSTFSADDRGNYHFGHLRPGTYFVAVSARPWYAQADQQGLGGTHVSANFSNGSEIVGTNDSQPVILGDTGNSLEGGGRAREQTASPFDVAYPLTYYSSVTDASMAAPIELKAGDRMTADVTLQAVPALHLRVKVPNTDATQPPTVAVQQQTLAGMKNGINAPYERTAPDEIKVSGLAPGHYTVQLQSAAFKLSTIERDVTLSAETGDVEIDGATPGSPSTTVTSTVTLDGTPVKAQAVVRLLNQAGIGILAGQVSDKVPPGRYDLQVQVPSLPNALVKSITATGAKMIGQSVEIPDGGAVQLKIALSTGVERVNGIALREDKPASGAMIVLLPSDPEHNPALIRRDQSDSDGTFTVYNVLPGKYTVLAIANGWDLEWLSPDVLRPYLQSGQVVDVQPGQKYDIRVQVQ